MNDKIIFIAEDDPTMLEIYNKGFIMEGFRLEIAHDGQEAKEMLENSNEVPQIFLLDIMMPRMNGYELLEYIKSKDNLKNVPVIFLTNLSSPEDVKKGKALGAQLFLVKSDNTPHQIVEKVKAFINTH